LAIKGKSDGATTMLTQGGVQSPGLT
jgi:1-aminocyclopropane-1-carboxylate deaminase/D-cysteine desulfhydrase-like pyridoxal-dependent ACC family enzyme